MTEHEHLFRTDISFAAFWCHWRKDDHPNPENELAAIFSNLSREVIQKSLATGQRLVRAVYACPNPFGDADSNQTMTFDEVVVRLKASVKKASEEAYRTAADKVFLINR